MKKIVISILTLAGLFFSAPLCAQESCYEQYLREHNMPFLTAEDADDSYEELKKEVLARQAIRKEALFQPLMLAVDTISGACHLLSQDGSLIADVHLAMVDSTWYMWLSVDPLADKNISNTPYMYCNGNPIMLIDPDGRDEWDFDLQGNVVKYTKNEEADIIRYVDKNGHIRNDKDGKPMEIKYAFGSLSVSTIGDLTIVSAAGDEVGRGVFEFLAQFGIVTEWTLLQTGIGSEGNNYISTSHHSATDNSYLKVPEIYPFTHLRSQTHNHPGNNDSPSGLTERVKNGVLQKKGEWGDIQVKTDQQKRWGSLVVFQIYLPGTMTYVTF